MYTGLVPYCVATVSVLAPMMTADENHDHCCQVRCEQQFQHTLDILFIITTKQHRSHDAALLLNPLRQSSQD